MPLVLAPQDAESVIIVVKDGRLALDRDVAMKILVA